jgi:hypothetical protein
MSFYLWLNVIILAFPLVFSFERRWIKFYKKLKPVLVSLLIVGIFFSSWVFATSRGHWSCAREKVITIGSDAKPKFSKVLTGTADIEINSLKRLIKMGTL